MQGRGQAADKQKPKATAAKDRTVRELVAGRAAHRARPAWRMDRAIDLEA